MVGTSLFESLLHDRGAGGLGGRWYGVYPAVVSDISDPDLLWAGVEIDGVWRSRDGGANWERFGTGLSSADIHAIAVVRYNQSQVNLLAAIGLLDVNNGTPVARATSP